MPRAHKPRSGSLQFWPRKRARRIYPRIRSWGKTEKANLLGFIGYKVGITQIQGIDQNPNRKIKDPIVTAATIIECPPLKGLSARYYKKTNNGLKVIGETLAEKLDKSLARKIRLPKKVANKEIKEYDDIRLLMYTQPGLTSIGKKKPEIMEVALSGSKEEKLELVHKYLNSEIKVSDIFKDNTFVDIHAVTKGYGFQGSVKRYGIALKSHKSEKTRRSVGNMGSWTPKKVSFRVPQHGQTGYHTRTEYNKFIYKISNNLLDVNPKSGFLHYGFIKNDYVIIKGSIAGPVKRPVKFTFPIRQIKNAYPFQMIQVKK
ncbi:50S ribosomal protein L3 [Candidatus Woesearchaeota archaeon]|nr:50S ribosomal protein L3 [Candidatus Woesearchaeota archaeon]